MRLGVKHAVIWKRKGSGTESSECKGPEAEAFLWAPWEYRAGELDTRPIRKGGEWPEKVIRACGRDEGCGLYSEPGGRVPKASEQ